MKVWKVKPQEWNGEAEQGTVLEVTKNDIKVACKKEQLVF